MGSARYVGHDLFGFRCFMKLAHRCKKCGKRIYVCRGYKLRLHDHLKLHPANVTPPHIGGMAKNPWMPLPGRPS